MPAKMCIMPAKIAPYLVMMPLELIGAMWWPTVPPLKMEPWEMLQSEFAN